MVAHPVRCICPQDSLTSLVDWRTGHMPYPAPQQLLSEKKITHTDTQRHTWFKNSEQELKHDEEAPHQSKVGWTPTRVTTAQGATSPHCFISVNPICL